MTWVKIDDTLPGNPKVRSVSPAARWTYISSICYSSLHKLNGDIQRNMLGNIDGTPKIATELMAAGLWEPRPDGWYVHDYLKHNRSKETMAQRTETYRANRLGRTNSAAISSTKREQIVPQTVFSLSLSSDPTLTENVLDLPEREREANCETNSSEPWLALSREGQDTFQSWALAIGERFVHRPDSFDMVLDMCQCVDENDAEEIRECIRVCRRDNVKPWPREVRARLVAAREARGYLGEAKRSRDLKRWGGQRI